VQVKVEVTAVRSDGMVHAATFQKDAQVALTVIQVPPQLRRLEFARTTPSGDPLQQDFSPPPHPPRGRAHAYLWQSSRMGLRTLVSCSIEYLFLLVI